VSGTPSVSVISSPYTFNDVGAVGIKGATSYSNGTFTMVASGSDIWNTADEFGYVYVPVNGDCTVTAQVASLQNVNASTKAGVMIRETLAAGSKYAAAVMTPGGSFLFQYRDSTDGSAAQGASSSRTIPYWVRLVRSGNTITAYRSSSGSRWSQVGSTITISMSTRVYVGLALTSHDDTKTASANFSSFSVVSPGTLTAPTGLSITASSSSVILSWTALTGATSYNILRATSLDGTYTTIATGVTGTTYTDSAVATGTTYYYRISATGSSGEGCPSGAVAAMAKNWVPASLSALGGKGQVLLSWSTVADADSYRIWRATSAGGSFTSVGISTLSSFIDSTVSNGTKYYYKVTAMLGGAESDVSSQASATPENASTGPSGTWANASLTTNGNRYNLTTTLSNTSLVVTDASGNPHTIGVGEIVSPINAVAGFGTRYSYWVVATSSNTLSVSDTPGGTAIKATATTTNTNALRGSQRWSAGLNWTNGIIPSGVDAVATFPNNSLPLDVGAVLVDMDLVLGKLVYSNSANYSDCTLVSAVVGTNTNSLRFAVSGTNTSLQMPMIEVPVASQKRLELGTVASGGPALRVVGSQGLMIRASAGGGVTNGIGSNPLKDLAIQNVDWSGFSGGLVVERGTIGPSYTNRLPPQDLVLGTGFSVSNNVLAGVKMGAAQTIAALNGNAMGRICGLGVLTIGTNNTGGDFGGIVGQEFNGVRDSNSIMKIGTNRQVMSGAMVGNGSLDVAEGTLVFTGSGTNMFSGAVTVSNGAALYLNSTHAPVSPYASATLVGTLNSATFVSSVAMKNDDTLRVTAAAAGLTLGAEYYVVQTPTTSTNIQIATTKGGPSFVANATANATAQFSSTTNGISGIYTIASGGTLGGNGRIAPRDTVGGLPPAISVYGHLAPGPEGAHTFGTLILDGANCSRSLIKFEPSADISFQVGATNCDTLVFTNTQAGDVIFTSNTINFIDDSDGSLPMQTVIFASDSTTAFSGIATNTNGLITNGLAIGSGLSAYPQAALYMRTNTIVLRLAPIPPPAPAFLTANATNNQVELNWSSASGAKTYSVYRAPSQDGLFDTVATGIFFTTFTDTNFIPGTTYYYRVRSVANNLESDDFASAFANTSIPAKQSWRIMYFNTAEETDITADSADPDHDGLVNLMEYALGRDPTHAERTPPLGMAISTNGPRLTITFNRTNDPALVYTVFGTDSLVGTNIWTNPVWTSTGSNNTAGPVTVPDTATTTEKSQRFLRLNVR
jgi:fibronectin type 3 domain-containing protein